MARKKVVAVRQASIFTNPTQHGSTHIHPARSRNLTNERWRAAASPPQERMEGRTQQEEDEGKRNSFTATEAMNEQTHLAGTTSPISRRRSSAPMKQWMEQFALALVALSDRSHPQRRGERARDAVSAGSLHHQMDSAERKGKTGKRETEAVVESYLCSAITGVLSSDLCLCSRTTCDGISRSRSRAPQAPVGTTGANWRVGARGQPVPVGPRRGRVGISFHFPGAGREGMTWSSGYVCQADLVAEADDPVRL